MVSFVFFNPLLAKQQLADNEIHLWSLAPEQINIEHKLDSLIPLLSKSEVHKVQRYRHPKGQHDALITRLFIRSILALYTDQAPQDLRFTITAQGKPELCNGTLPIRFNLSHNNDLIICAVCLDHDIGCDVESLARKINIESIAKRYFSSDEYQSLQMLSPAAQKTRFFEYWTLKEAFVKATGLGISQGLNSFSFNIAAAEKTTFNDRITLSFAENSKLQNHQDWYSCLNYLEQKHCIAICVKNESNRKKFTIKYFQGNDYLTKE